MNKVTKRPKKVTVGWTTFLRERSSYRCPSCKAHYEGFVTDRNVTQFKCACSQILNVENYSGC